MENLMIKRVYEDLQKVEAKRVLVDRIWPRGISKEKLALDLWAKEVAPSNQLRKEFNHQPEKFDWFRAAYRKELQQNTETQKFIEQIRQWLQTDKVWLVYGAKDKQHNQAVVLKEYILENIAE
ncbi:DUF488 domain-containing protein [Enterococcus olivae]